MAANKKLVSTIAAVATSAALLLGGTLAWQSANQTALNEASDVVNPGGRLHDDFDGENKDVYVENFAEENIFARIRLEEYFEIITNYGKEGAEKSHYLIGSKNEDDTFNYELFYFDGNVDEEGVVSAGIDDDDYNEETYEYKSYWSWQTGGSTVYMPTFNLNKDSLAADVNGIYEKGNVGTISNRFDPENPQYTEYTDWSNFTGENGTVGVDATLSGTEIYDDDANDVDDGGILEVLNVEHTAANTLDAQLISMADWLQMLEDNGGYGASLGNYWVYDTDGWVYWSAPIEPHTATGLLLDGIKLNQVMDDTWYYAINVVAQFVTADDVGKTDGTGFYADGEAPSPEAEDLLRAIGVFSVDEEAGGEDDWGNPISTIVLSHDGNSDTVSGGEFLLFGADVYNENGDVIASTDDVTFGVQEVPSSEAAAMALFDSTTMQDNALMVADEIVNSNVGQLIITATYTDENNISYEGTYTLDVAAGESPLHISLKIGNKDISYYRPGVYQLFPAEPSADTYSFSASVNNVPAEPTWSAAYVDEYAPFSTATDEYGIQTISTNAEWDNGWKDVPAGTDIARINTSTGVFEVLLDNEYYPRGMEFYITASDATSGYENTVVLCLYRVDVNFNLLNADVADQNSIAAHSATYTAHKDSVINISFDLMVNGVKENAVVSNLSNWKLYEGNSYNDELIDDSKYTITTDAANRTAKLTIPGGSGIEAEELQLTVEYNHGVEAPRTPNGISEGTLNITEANAAGDADAVHTFYITDDNGGEEAAYTPGKYQKIRLTANALTEDDNEVYSGYVTWILVDSDSAATTLENVTLKSNGFNAEVWLTGATADTITVKAQYETPEGGVEKDDTFVITAEYPYTPSLSFYVDADPYGYIPGHSDNAITLTPHAAFGDEDVLSELTNISWDLEDSDDSNTTLTRNGDGTATLLIDAGETAPIIVNVTYMYESEEYTYSLTIPNHPPVATMTIYDSEGNHLVSTYTKGKQNTIELTAYFFKEYTGELQDQGLAYFDSEALNAIGSHVSFYTFTNNDTWDECIIDGVTITQNATKPWKATVTIAETVTQNFEICCNLDSGMRASFGITASE